MAAPSVNDFSSLINNQIESREKMHESLLKAEALACVALSRDFLDCGHSIINDYLSALFDFILESKNRNQAALDYLLKYRRQSGPFG